VSHQELRREARFPLRYPATVKASIKGLAETAAVTENVSAHGVLLSVDSFIPQGTRSEIVLNLKPAASQVQLVYTGTVLRSERSQAGTFAVAVECERCLTVRSEEKTGYGKTGVPGSRASQDQF
jgi:hypothetical protein